MKAKHQTDALATAKRLAPFCLCGAHTSLKYLHVLMAEMDGVRRAPDSEGVHRMRVALRRLRSVLPLFTACLSRKTCDRWRKQLRRLTRTLGGVRDLDVQLACVQQVLDTGTSEVERAGLERILLRLRQRRHTLQKPVVEALNRFAASDLMAEMEHTLMQLASTNQAPEGEMPGRSVYRKMRKAMLTRLKALQEYAPYVQRPECLKELHALRIAAKRLRYTLQAFAPLYQVAIAESIHAAQTLQTLLGDMHDCDVWAHDLPPFLEAERARTLEYCGHMDPFALLAPGILTLQHNRAQYREHCYQEFVTFWYQAQAEGVWERLRHTVEAPCTPVAEAAVNTAPADVQMPATAEEERPVEQC